MNAKTKTKLVKAKTPKAKAAKTVTPPTQEAADAPKANKKPKVHLPDGLATWTLPENIYRVRGWARDGLTMDEIAINMRIARRTLYNWINSTRWAEEVKNLALALRDGKDVADRIVENALFESARKGNVTAQIFWLKNRKSAQWRDRQEVVSLGAENIAPVKVVLEYKSGKVEAEAEAVTDNTSEKENGNGTGNKSAAE